jgi:hypothetical protein
MEASFYPTQHQFNKNDNFDNRLELQHETLKRIITIGYNLANVSINKVNDDAPFQIKLRKKTKKNKV